MIFKELFDGLKANLHIPLNATDAERMTPSDGPGLNVVSCQVCSNSWDASMSAVQLEQFWPTLHCPVYDIIFPVRSSPSVSSIDTFNCVHSERTERKDSKRKIMV